jgi:hypothetical protein
MRYALLVLIAACAAARGQVPATVRSAQADSVAVTVYRDNLALITETRTVDLPAGPARLVIEGVVETLVPQSAVIDGLDRPLAETNFDFDALTPASLIERSVGKTVILTRTNPASGTVRRVAATILAAGPGVVLRTEDGNEALHCTGLPERLEFEDVPEGLLSKPRLTVRLAGGAPGERTVQVSYLAHGFSWSADYVGRLSGRGSRMHLTGWVTLTNETNATFEQAQVQMVAGNLNLVDVSDGGSQAEPVWPLEGESFVDARQRSIERVVQRDLAILGRCYEADPATLYARRNRFGAQTPMLEEIVVTASRAQRETLGDYQLYRLPWQTDFAARQTKQVVLLDKPAVRIQRLYAYRIDEFDDGPGIDPVVPDQRLRFENTERSGLGEPLPRGRLRVFEPHGNDMVFAGEDTVEDRPVGLTVEVTVARALDVAVEWTSEDLDIEALEDLDRVRVVVQHRVTNAKNVPIEVEVRHGAGEYWLELDVRKASTRTRSKNGDPMWRLRVPPGRARELTYEMEATQN